MESLGMCGRLPRQFFLGLLLGLTIAFVITGSRLIDVNFIRPAGFSTHNPHHPKDLARNISDGEDWLTDHDAWDNSHKDDKVKKLNFTSDAHLHDDDESEARRLATEIRVLIWVMTSPQNLKDKARAVRDTWGQRANKLLFFSSKTNRDFPTVGLNVSEGREHLTAKTMQGFRYVYDHHLNDAEWFMKADDDTYVIVENLRYFLSGQNTEEPIFFGHHFKTIVKQGYYSGGGGYVLSKEALRRFGKNGNNPNICRQDGGAEDAEFGTCMEKLGVKTANTTDVLGRSRFHCFDPETHLFGGYPDWYHQYDANGAKKGEDSMSDYAITFHYVPPQKMQALEYFIYHLSPYGIQQGRQKLNKPHQNLTVTQKHQ